MITSSECSGMSFKGICKNEEDLSVENVLHLQGICRYDLLAFVSLNEKPAVFSKCLTD